MGLEKTNNGEGNIPSWFDVIIGQGKFVVRAASEEEAITLAEQRAVELEKLPKYPIVIGNGLPFVSESSWSEYHEKTWFEDKPPAEISEYYDQPESFEPLRCCRFDYNQQVLFDTSQYRKPIS